MTNDTDVIVIGAGGGGPVIAKELGEKGIQVILIEAGPWYGSNKWPQPNQEPGAVSDSCPENLSKETFDRCYTNYEGEMNDFISGKLRWGPADRTKPSWFRYIPQGGFIWQTSGVGGTTQVYLANSPRAFPIAVDGVWPISYREMIPYYEKVEATLPVTPAPMTPKEELFFYGAKKAGWPLLKTLNVTMPGYRTQPNAILPTDPNINDPEFKLDYRTEGCTLCGHCINGCHIGPTVEKTAKRSTLVSYIPLALQTGKVEVRPNSFVMKVLTDNVKGDLRAIGVQYRDTWTGETGELRAKVVVMAGGSFETPRLWINSKLPDNPWVGKGLTHHWFDCVTGIFDEQVLMKILGVSNVKPYMGQNSAARFDYPGVGVLQQFCASPGIFSTLIYGFSQYGYRLLSKNEETPFVLGRVVGKELKELMMDYTRTYTFLVFTDDEVNQQNEVSIHQLLKDEHGPISVIKYHPGKREREKRDKMASIAADILKKSGAKKIIRTDCAPGTFAHAQSTMRMGYVTDINCEALQVKRLFIADNSVLYNSLGGPNPTLTTQALATRTAEKLANRYF